MVAPLVIGALLAAAQTEQQRQQMKQQQAMEAGKARYSPWTHMTADTGSIKAPDAVGNAMSSGATMMDMAQKNPGMFGGGKGTMEGAVDAAPSQVPMASAANPAPPTGSAGAVGATAMPGGPGGAGYTAPWRQGMYQGALPGQQPMNPWAYMGGPMRPPGQ